MSAVAALKAELDYYKDAAAERDKMIEDFEIMKLKMKDYEEMHRTVENLRGELRDSKSETDQRQGRVGTLEHELARLKERFQKNEKDLAVKDFTVNRLRKNLKFQNRALEGSKKKMTKVERSMDKLAHENKLNQHLREQKEAELEDVKEESERERMLRLIGMYMHQKSVVDAETRFRELLKLPNKVHALEKEINRLTRENNVLKDAVEVEAGIHEMHEEDLRLRDVEDVNMQAKLAKSKEESQNLRESCAKWSEKWSVLQSYCNKLQHKLVSTWHSSKAHGLEAQLNMTSIGDLIKEAPKAPFPLGKNWGHGHNELPGYQQPTYTSKIRMRGKTPGEIVDILQEKVDTMETQKGKVEGELKDLQYKHEKKHMEEERVSARLHKRRLAYNRAKEQLAVKMDDLSTRVREMGEAREEGIQRYTLLVARLEARANEVNPYKTPRHLLKKKPKTRHEGSARIQAMYRSWKSRKTFTEDNIKLQVDLEIEIPGKRASVEEQKQILKDLEEETVELEKDLKVVQQNKASLGADIQRKEEQELPKIEMEIKDRKFALEEATEERRRAAADLLLRRPDRLASTLGTGETAEDTVPLWLTTPTTAGQKVRTTVEEQRRLMQKERGWGGGGFSAPSRSGIRTSVSAPYSSSLLLPPRMRKKLARDAATAALGLTDINQLTSDAYTPDGLGYHPVFNNAHHTPKQILPSDNLAGARDTNTAHSFSSNVFGRTPTASETTRTLELTARTVKSAPLRRGPRERRSRLSRSRNRSRASSRCNTSGSMFVGRGLGLTKSTDMRDKIQNKLEISTKGSTKQILRRIQKHLGTDRYSFIPGQK